MGSHTPYPTKQPESDPKTDMAGTPLPEVGDKLTSTTNAPDKQKALGEVMSVDGNVVQVVRYDDPEPFLVNWDKTHYWAIFKEPKFKLKDKVRAKDGEDNGYGVGELVEQISADVWRVHFPDAKGGPARIPFAEFNLELAEG